MWKKKKSRTSNDLSQQENRDFETARQRSMMDTITSSTGNTMAGPSNTIAGPSNAHYSESSPSSRSNSPSSVDSSSLASSVNSSMYSSQEEL